MQSEDKVSMFPLWGSEELTAWEFSFSFKTELDSDSEEDWII